MDEAIYRTADGRAYTVRDGVSVWLDEISTAAQPAYEYVGFGLRFAAKLIDTALTYLLGFLTGAFVFLFASVVAGLTGAASPLSTEPLGSVTPTVFFLSAVAVVVFDVLAEGVHGSTPGKMILGLTVRSTDGGYCGFGQALKRALGFYVDSLFFGIPAFSSMRGSSLKQRIGDRWAHTVVVRNRSIDPGQRRSGLRFLASTTAACLGFCMVTVLVTFA